MGCYDTITFDCPACGTPLAAQSKSGKCLLESFPHTSVPMNIAYDANRHAPIECKCGKVWHFRNIAMLNEHKVALTIVEGDL